MERSIREVNELFGDIDKVEVEKECTNETFIAEEIVSVLSIHQRHLNPNNELKRMFGSKVVNTAVEFRYGLKPIRLKIFKY